MDDILSKNSFSIQDLARVVGKQTNTIRVWERKGILTKSTHRSDRGWRIYTPKEFAESLEQIIKYPWERKVIKNEEYIRQLIDSLKSQE